MAAKNVIIFPGIKYRGVLDNSFTRVSTDNPNKVNTGFVSWCNEWQEDPARRFVAVGLGDVYGEKHIRI